MKLKDFDFRIWDKHHKGCGNKDCKCQTKYVYGEEAKTRLSEFKEDCEIELFTGYYDDKGNKIYVGDIIECLTFTNENHSEVFYEIICFDMELGLCSKLTNGESGYLFDLHMNSKNKIIEDAWVVGNIHEDANLPKEIK